MGIDGEGRLRHLYHGPPVDRAHDIPSPDADPLTPGALGAVMTGKAIEEPDQLVRE